MKTQVLSKVLVAGLAIAIGAVCGFAGSQSVVMKVKVPFAFSAGDVTLPAGEYTITKENARGTLLIQGSQANEVCLVQTFSGITYVPDGNGSLLFKRYGDKYFLSQVFPGFESAGHKLGVSKLEKEYIAAGPAMAAQKSEPVEVIVAAVR
jgi:hypothetical protein